jgi:hypothetical protein
MSKMYCHITNFLKNFAKLFHYGCEPLKIDSSISTINLYVKHHQNYDITV